MSYRLLRTAAVVARGAARFGDLAAGFAAQAIDRSERSSLTARLYDAVRPRVRSTVFEWEKEWLGRDLPAPPSRVLLGGAGNGREARWLIDQGYTVVAFDPARECVARHNALCPEAQCVVLDYESLARAHRALDRGAARSVGAASVLEAAPYDAVLIGWGSLSHVLEERDQEALFEALAALVPRGPILASFIMGRVPPLGRAMQLGAKLGSALGPAEHAYPAVSDHVRCSPYYGFAYAFDRVRLAQIAQCVSRTLELYEDGGYPHATFR